MKKFILILITYIVLFQTAQAKYVNEANDEKIIAVEKYKTAMCIAKQSVSGELELLSNFGFTKSELRKSMRSTTLLNRVAQFFPVLLGSYLAINIHNPINPNHPWFINPLTQMPNPEKVQTATNLIQIIYFIIINGAVTATYDDGSHYIYGLFPFGIGELTLREDRLNNLLSRVDHKINEQRFEKILDIIPSLKPTYVKCKIDDFKSIAQ